MLFFASITIQHGHGEYLTCILIRLLHHVSKRNLTISLKKIYFISTQIVRSLCQGRDLRNATAPALEPLDSGLNSFSL